MKPDPSDAATQSDVTPEYEAPRVETVMTSDEVEREAHYGGLVSMT